MRDIVQRNRVCSEIQHELKCRRGFPKLEYILYSTGEFYRRNWIGEMAG